VSTEPVAWPTDHVDDRLFKIIQVIFKVEYVFWLTIPCDQPQLGTVS
jgi:hypothetical protein